MHGVKSNLYIYRAYTYARACSVHARKFSLNYIFSLYN